VRGPGETFYDFTGREDSYPEDRHRRRVLGLSAVVAGSACELTAETATPCQVNFVEREALLRFLGKHGEAGLHSAQALSKEFQSAYQDIHDLALARSSGKLARLLLSWSPAQSNGG
jgi:CRP/FNR family cyclic AMP-dependent transcriptional regulator